MVQYSISAIPTGMTYVSYNVITDFNIGHTFIKIIITLGSGSIIENKTSYDSVS